MSRNLVAKVSSDTVFQFQPDFGFFAVDSELATVGVEKVVVQDGVELVVEGCR